MTKFDGPEEQQQLASALRPDLTVDQVWALVKFAKHVRGRCRNNAAFNPYMARMFPNFKFEAISKVSKIGRPYMGLKITDRNTGAVIDGSEEDADE